jgi:hypothetical protein
LDEKVQKNRVKIDAFGEARGWGTRRRRGGGWTAARAEYLEREVVETVTLAKPYRYM